MHSLYFPAASLLTVAAASAHGPLAAARASSAERVLFACGAGRVALALRSASPEPATVVRVGAGAGAGGASPRALPPGATLALAAELTAAAPVAAWEARDARGAAFKRVEVRLAPASRL